jgi:hypothetical protein
MAVSALELARSFTAIHMGSARYYHPQELEVTPLPDTRTLFRDLAAGRAATCEFRLRFYAASQPELVSGAVADRVVAAQQEGTPETP